MVLLVILCVIDLDCVNLIKFKLRLQEILVFILVQTRNHH